MAIHGIKRWFSIAQIATVNRILFGGDPCNHSLLVCVVWKV